jgi:2-polyprenyl-3-methyl-5-hydroxy-6-metoxy-1,4-benzoquinol methylase
MTAFDPEALSTTHEPNQPASTVGSPWRPAGASSKEMDVSDDEFQGLNEAVREIWDTNADYWNERMGDGNEFHRMLIGPTQERLLSLRPGETVLDIGCGNGQFARRMAQLGAHVLAVDVSPRMIEHARANTLEHQERIDYRIIDATNHAMLLTLGHRCFDAAVCTMAMMDMASIDPLVSSLSSLLKAEGRFVFSVMHPCFNSARVKLVAEEGTTEAGDLVTRYCVRVSDYIHPRATKGVAMKGQPAPHYYFDRPISALFTTCFKSGFVLDGLEEPTFRVSAGDGRANWSNITDIPPVLAARMRLLG